MYTWILNKTLIKLISLKCKYSYNVTKVTILTSQLTYRSQHNPARLIALYFTLGTITSLYVHVLLSTFDLLCLVLICFVLFCFVLSCFDLLCLVLFNFLLIGRYWSSMSKTVKCCYFSSRIHRLDNPLVKVIDLWSITSDIGFATLPITTSSIKVFRHHSMAGSFTENMSRLSYHNKYNN